jgi:hypothetical protein
MRLINAESFVLDEIGQRAMAKWIGLSALMANRVAKTQHKFPNEDIANFYNHKEPPPHWFIGIGRFSGLRGCSANQGIYVEGIRDVATGEESVAFIKHAIAATMGDLYTLVDANIHTSHRLAKVPPGPVYAPHIFSIQPLTLPGIPFPPPRASTIWGPHHFWPGTNASEVARRFVERLSFGATLLRGAARI